MANKKVKDEVVFFANTLWFIINFKKSLIIELLKKGYLVKIIYLRIGPVFNLEDEFINKDNLFVQTFMSFCLNIIKKEIHSINHTRRRILLAFTISPIILSSLPLFYRYEKYATLEGLGRVFTSKYIIFRILRRVVERIYKFLFLRIYKSVFVLNHVDFSYLLENNIIPISKINVIPGTGINQKKFNPANLYKLRLEKGIIDENLILNKADMYITYIGRISVDKGFYRFLSSALSLIDDKNYKNLKFRIVAPSKDIEILSKDLKIFLKKKHFLLEKYLRDPLIYYSSALLVVLPTTYGEGLSRVALESGLLGIPVAAMNNRGISSLFMDGILGEITLDSEPYGITKIIKKILDNYSKYSILSEDTYKNLADKYGDEASTNSVLKILEKLNT
ncbi:glycosyltransferase [Prochlorococcus sp. AH-736-M13]|nr:glycosyltransferase [Prochlorococcus sp. AH-736-M13]MDA9746862.1 glycosyltransferase [Prochlorococcus sp. AH-736-M13]